MVRSEKKRAESNARSWSTVIKVDRRPYCPCCTHAIEHGKWWVSDGVAVCLDCIGVHTGSDTLKLARQSLDLEQGLLRIAQGIYWYVPPTLATQSMTLAQRVYDRMTDSPPESLIV